MCGRYSFAPKKEKIVSEFPELEFPDNWAPRFNIAPTQSAAVVTNTAPSTVQMYSWGLIPYWVKGKFNQGSTINARSETISSKAMLRDAFKKRRCLVLADSFYEWKMGADRHKHPYRILPADGHLLVMAGIWETWKKQDATIIHSFSILTTTPNREVSELHDRMPVILENKSKRQLWLSDTVDADVLEPLFVPVADGSLQIYRVSDALNRAGGESPEFHTPVAEQGNLFTP